MYTKGYAEEGKLYEEQIVVEHAVIVIPARGREKMSGYFSIWNGTDEYLWIKGFESIQFATITLDEPTGVNGKYVSKPEPIPKALPPKTELVMSKGGVQYP
jgi:alpha-D-ribose 1-methylphosphonate 5-phosphate C-P lyase